MSAIVGRVVWREMPAPARASSRGTPLADAPSPALTDEAAPDFAADPEVVRAVAEGEALAYGHPAFAVETALIDPLPHQPDPEPVIRRYLTQAMPRRLTPS